MAVPEGFLGKLGYALDTPGAYTRGLFGGQAGERISGRQMLQNWGALGENKQGFDMGDFAGFLAEVLFDPINLIPFGSIAKGFKGVSSATKANRATMAMIKAGAMPDELAKATKLVDAAGNPSVLHHGTPHAYPLRPDFERMDPGALFGRGLYTTEDVVLPGSAALEDIGKKGIITNYYANGATTRPLGEAFAPQVRMHHILSERPFNAESTHKLEPFLPYIGDRFGTNVPRLPGRAGEVLLQRHENATRGLHSFDELEKRLDLSLRDKGTVREFFSQPPVVQYGPSNVKDLGHVIHRLAESSHGAKLRRWNSRERALDARPVNVYKDSSNVSFDDLFNLGEGNPEEAWKLAQYLAARVRNKKLPGMQAHIERKVPEEIGGEELLLSMQQNAPVLPTGVQRQYGNNPLTKGSPVGETGDALRDLGYDSIAHVGGRFAGSGRRLHNVNIGLYPDRVFGPWVAPPMQNTSMSPLMKALAMGSAPPSALARYGSAAAGYDEEP